MNNLNFIFLEEYKHLDRLCSELYDGEPGVTNYINDMKSVDWNDCRHIPSWKTNLSQLIRLRHIRNHLAHTEGAFHENLCTNKDVDWLKDFHRQILKQEDPLAMLRKCSLVKKVYKHTDTANGNKTFLWGNVFLVISVFLVLITVVYILIQTIS